MFAKWFVLFRTLPFVGAVLGTRWLLKTTLNFEGLIDFSDVSVVLTAGVFLIGFMLSGVMADYKESERLPAEIACMLEHLANLLTSSRHSQKDGATAAVRDEYLRLLDTILAFLKRKATSDEVFDGLNRVAAAVRPIESVNKTIVFFAADLHGLRKLLARMNVISKTNFLAPGYALLEILVTGVLTVTTVAKYHSPVAQTLLQVFVPLVYVYMYRLIRDLDDPFEYTEGGAAGAAEVELFPIFEAAARIRRSPLLSQDA